MALYLKRWVSGKKTRFRDVQLDLELDLAYLTDQIIVMGFPAVGVESIYRNHRADVQRFLSARHGSDFWVFNFCPLRENSYPDDVFEGRVSRYPFPDHHVPPFPYFSLVTREIHAWLSGSDTRIAVLHCKAGKGRSGVLACAYLLSHQTPLSISLQENLSDWSLIGDEEIPLADTSTSLAPINERQLTHPASPISGVDLSRVLSEPALDTLQRVLDFHTSRRMKLAPPLARHHSDAPFPQKTKMGVSIPSQRRWLFYWSQALNKKQHSSLRPFLQMDRSQPADETPQIKNVRLTELTIRMREPSGIQPRPAQAAGRLCISLARYSDELVDELGRWEKESRNSFGETMISPFRSDRWDKGKMLRSFSRMGVLDIQSTPQNGSGRSVVTYVLRPLNEGEGDPCTSMSESSYAIVSLPASENDLENKPSILLDAHRELHIKLFAGKVTLGWAWIIPAFHLSPNSASSNVVLSSGDIDFATGMGKMLVDMKISFTCLPCMHGS